MFMDVTPWSWKVGMTDLRKVSRPRKLRDLEARIAGDRCWDG